MRIHPIWRGVGCALMVLAPVIAYAAMEVFLDLNQKNNWRTLPADLIVGPGDILYSIVPDPLIQIKLLLFIIFTLLFFALVTFFSFLISSAFGATPKRDPYYVPPVQRRRRRIE